MGASFSSKNVLYTLRSLVHLFGKGESQKLAQTMKTTQIFVPFLAVIFCLSITSCGTQSTQSYKLVNSTSDIPSIADHPKDCTIEIRRHSGFLAHALKAVLSINGHDVAILGPSERVLLRLPGGNYKFSVRWTGDAESASSIRLNLSRGQPVKLGVSVQKSDSLLWRAQPSIMEL